LDNEISALENELTELTKKNNQLQDEIEDLRAQEEDEAHARNSLRESLKSDLVVSSAIAAEVVTHTTSAPSITAKTSIVTPQITFETDAELEEAQPTKLRAIISSRNRQLQHLQEINEDLSAKTFALANQLNRLCDHVENMERFSAQETEQLKHKIVLLEHDIRLAYEEVEKCEDELHALTSDNELMVQKLAQFGVRVQLNGSTLEFEEKAPEPDKDNVKELLNLSIDELLNG